MSTRALHESSFHINDFGLVSIEPVGGNERILGRVGIDDIEPDLFPEERVQARLWKETSDFLGTHRIRSKVRLVAEREPRFIYGFLWIVFSFDRNQAKKRWGRDFDINALDRATEALAEAIPEKTYPDYHGSIEKEQTRWVFQIDISDTANMEKFFKVFFRALAKMPVLREYLMPA